MLTKKLRIFAWKFHRHGVWESKRKVQKSKGQKSRPRDLSSKSLLAAQEHEAIVSAPEAGRPTVASAKPAVTKVAAHEEHAQITIGVVDSLHSDDEPFAYLLVLILQT
jgi:hypothetical protein